jgi:soluble lytic murein transglycosylase-like protein
MRASSHEPVEHAPRAACARRRRVAAVAATSLLLLLAGASPDPERRPVAEPPPGASPQPDEHALARALASRNPQLSPHELRRIARAVGRYSAKYELDPELVTALIWVESEALPGARSPKGAMGLMQVMPHMLAPLGLAGNSTTVESNVEAGCRILSDNIRRLGEEDGILAYFWGSRIRGAAYLERVRAARAEVRRLLVSS